MRRGSLEDHMELLFITIKCTYVILHNRIQVFNLDLKFSRSFCSSDKGKLHAPDDIKFDITGYMYIVEHEMRVQVLDSSGNFIRVFGERRGSSPSGLCIIDDYV